jgi:hypothetical protein
MEDITVEVHEYGSDRITPRNTPDSLKKIIKNQIYIKYKYGIHFIRFPKALTSRLKTLIISMIKYLYYLSPVSFKTLYHEHNWRYVLLKRSIIEYFERFRKQPLLPDSKHPQIIYMTGMPRTGSSLMKNYLGDYEGFEIQPFQPKGFQVNWRKSIESDKILIDKSTHYIRHLEKIHATCKKNVVYCCIIRDPRDQLLSLLNFERHPELPRNNTFWKKWFKQYNSFIQFAEKQETGDCFLVRYEDLVRYPEEVKKSFLS